MIILSGVLVILAIALLVTGIVAGADGIGGIEGLTLIYISIGISIVSALCLAIGVFLRRKELFGTTGAVPATRSKPVKPGKAARKARQAREAREAEARDAAESSGAPAFAAAEVHPEPADDTVAMPSHSLEVPPDAPVWVVRGRKRYHLENCRQLAGREREELTYEEAVEEAFSPCTACMPDTALAARAAVSTGEQPSPLDEEPAESRSGESKAPATASDDSHEALPTSWDTPAFGSVDAETGTRPFGSADADPGTRPFGGLAGDPLSEGFEDLPSAAADEPAVAAPWESDQEPADAPTIPAPAASADNPAEPAEPVDVRILSGTKRYHRPDCALIEDIGDEAEDLETLSRDEAKARGCTPCLVCQPDKEPVDR